MIPTPKRVLAIAADLKARGVVWRDPTTQYVSIQQSAPYTGPNDRFGRDYVNHCTITIAHIYALAGLRFGIDYPECIQWTPCLAAELLRGPYRKAPIPQPGDIAVIDWQKAGYGAAAASDHGELVQFTHTGGRLVRTYGANTTPDGRIYEYDRDISLFTAWGSPRWPTRPHPATIAAAASLLLLPKG